MKVYFKPWYVIHFRFEQVRMPIWLANWLERYGHLLPWALWFMAVAYLARRIGHDPS